MTSVTKVIKGREYDYYQNSIKVKGKNKVITTCIGRTDLTSTELLKAREQALGKHIIKIYKTASIIQKTPYHFEHLPMGYKIIDVLEYIKIIYQHVINNLLPEELESIEKTIFIKYVYGTTAIEGNTISEEETAKLLTDELTPSNKPFNEALEIHNYNAVKRFVTLYRGDINDRLIRHIHIHLMDGVIGRNGKPIQAGKYRTTNVYINRVGFKPPPPEMIEERIHYLTLDYNHGLRNNIHPIELAAVFHQKFEEIHPFTDGNGRTGREIINYMLGRSGFPRIYITPKHRSAYLDALEEGNSGNYIPLITFILHRILATMYFLSAKTSMYKILESNETRESYIAMAGQAGDDLYKNMIQQLHEMRDSKELP